MKPILLCAIFFVSHACFAQSSSIEKQLDDLFTSRFLPSNAGCAVLISNHGKILYRKAFGKADLELNVPMKPEHVFRIGSITKQFTAVAILQLVEKGIIGLKDDITKFIPDYPTHGYSITIENLLSHTSGIKNMPESRDMNFGTKAVAPLEIMTTFKDEPMDFEPGTKHSYSNSGYIILGYIIEKASGLKYDAYLVKNIFTPANMRHAYYDDPIKMIPNRIGGYQQTSDTSSLNADYVNPSIPYAAGALIMTVDDLLSWHQALIANKLLKSETLKLAQTPFTLKDGTKVNYGFGWDLSDLYGSASIAHSGSISGFASMEIYLPGEDVFIAFLSNVMMNAADFTRLVACMVTSKPIVKEVSLTAGVFENYTGKYKFKLDQPSFIRIFEKDGKYFMLDSRGQKPWRMHFTSNTDFYCPEVFPNNHVFTKDASGKVDGFMIKAPGYESRITKIE